MLCYPQCPLPLTSPLDMNFTDDPFQDFTTQDPDHEQQAQINNISVPDPLDNIDVLGTHMWNHDENDHSNHHHNLQILQSNNVQQQSSSLVIPEQAFWDSLASITNANTSNILQDTCTNTTSAASTQVAQFPVDLQQQQQYHQSIHPTPLSYSQVTTSEDIGPPPTKRKRIEPIHSIQSSLLTDGLSTSFPLTSSEYHQSVTSVPLSTYDVTTLAETACNPSSINGLNNMNLNLNHLPLTSSQVTTTGIHKKNDELKNMTTTTTTTSQACIENGSIASIGLASTSSGGGISGCGSESLETIVHNVNYRSTVAKQRPKQWKRPTPSKFCHVCGRKSHTVQVVVCSRIDEGMCRKVVCKYCMEKYGWDMEVLRNENKKKSWICPHCLNRCVPKAQCNTYGKTNYKRHLKLRKRRADKALANAHGLKMGIRRNELKMDGSGRNC